MQLGQRGFRHCTVGTAWSQGLQSPENLDLTKAAVGCSGAWVSHSCTQSSVCALSNSRASPTSGEALKLCLGITTNKLAAVGDHPHEKALSAGVSLTCCGHSRRLNCVPLKRAAYSLTPRTCGLNLVGNKVFMVQ